MSELTHLDLFSGIGGFSLAAEACGFRTIAFCELDPEASLVLQAHWPDVPNLRDVRTIAAATYPYELPDLITAGVPCQPASALGLMRGTADERWLWPDTIRIMRELRPRFGVFENPPALLTLEYGRAWNGIVSGLVAIGYDLWWDVFPAGAFGAGHERERVLLVAYSHGERWVEEGLGILEGASNGNHLRRQPPEDSSQTVLDTDATRAGLQGHPWNGEDGEGWKGARRPVTPPDLRGRVTGPDWWHEAHTGVPVLSDGLPARLVEAASRCAGNSVCPQAVMPIMEAIAATFSHSPA